MLIYPACAKGGEGDGPVPLLPWTARSLQLLNCQSYPTAERAISNEYCF